MLNECLHHLLYEFKSESELIAAIQELSLKFTTNRDKISDYLKDPRLVSAYTAFYLTTNIPKFEAVLEWMPPGFLEDLKKLDLIDLGAGPGTFSIAWRKWGGQGKIYQVELSPVMREQALKLWQGLYPQDELIQLNPSQVKENRESILLFGHSANEMGPEKALQYIKAINPKHILFIEPGTKEFFSQILNIRKVLIQEGYNILFPCPGAGECAMGGSTNDWCHQFVHVKQNDEVERLSQLVKRDRRLLPLTVHAYSRVLQPRPEQGRIVRVYPETKFSLEWEVCTEQGIERYQLMKKNFDKNTLKELNKVLSGASVEVLVEKEMEQAKRVKLIKLNNTCF